MVNSSKTKFRQTEIVDVPEHWKIVKIDEIADILSGFPFKGDKYSDKGIRVLRGENVSIGHLRWDKEKRWNYDVKNLDKYYLADSDIVIGMDGRVGQNIAIIKETDLPLLLAQRIARLRSTKDSVQSFLYYAVSNERFLNYVKSIRTGTTIFHISSKQIAEFQILLPPLSEQDRIASILSGVDALIEQTQRIIEKMERLKKGLMQQLLTRGIGHTKFKKVKWLFGKKIEIPEEWEIKTLDDVADLAAGGTPSRFNYKYWHRGTIPWLSSGEIKNNIIIKSNERITVRGLEESAARLFPQGTIMIAITGQGLTRGRTALLNISATSNQSIIGIICKKDQVYNLFLWYYLQNEYWRLRSISQGSNQAGLNLNLLRTYQIVLPKKIKEQQTIASILSGVDAIKHNVTLDLGYVKSAAFSIFYKYVAL